MSTSTNMSVTNPILSTPMVLGTHSEQAVGAQPIVYASESAETVSSRVSTAAESPFYNHLTLAPKSIFIPLYSLEPGIGQEDQNDREAGLKDLAKRLCHNFHADLKDVYKLTDKLFRGTPNTLGDKFFSVTQKGEKVAAVVEVDFTQQTKGTPPKKSLLKWQGEQIKIFSDLDQRYLEIKSRMIPANSEYTALQAKISEQKNRIKELQRLRNQIQFSSDETLDKATRALEFTKNQAFSDPQRKEVMIAKRTAELELAQMDHLEFNQQKSEKLGQIDREIAKCEASLAKKEGIFLALQNVVDEIVARADEYIERLNHKYENGDIEPNVHLPFPFLAQPGPFYSYCLDKLHPNLRRVNITRSNFLEVAHEKILRNLPNMVL